MVGRVYAICRGQQYFNAWIEIDQNDPSVCKNQLSFEATIFALQSHTWILEFPAAVLGTVPDGTRVGDIVCVLFGSDVPFILRQVGNQADYKLIGVLRSRNHAW